MPQNKRLIRDIPREHIGELIEVALLRERDNRDDFLEGSKITLEADGWVTVTLKKGTIYNIKISRNTNSPI